MLCLVKYYVSSKYTFGGASYDFCCFGIFCPVVLSTKFVDIVNWGMSTWRLVTASSTCA